MGSVADTSAYIDLDPDEIMHWKYIKREKLANGKYRYYYDQSELDSQERSALKAKQDVDNAHQRVDEAKAELDVAESAMQKVLSSNNRKVNLNQISAMRLKVNEAYANLKLAEIKFDKTENAANKIVSKHAKESISSLPARILSKSIVGLLNLFSKVDNSTETMADLVKRNRNKKRIDRNYKNILGDSKKPSKYSSRTNRKSSKYF